MLTIRPYVKDDEEAVKTLYTSMKLPYELPDWEKPEFLVRTVLEDGHGPEMAVMLRKTAETYLFFDPQKGSRREKIGRILALTRECELAAHRAGLTDVFCVVPPAVEKFGELLVRFGWKKDEWPMYSRPAVIPNV